VKQGEKLDREEDQRNAKEDLKKVFRWQKTVFDKELASKQKAVEIHEAYTVKKEDFA